MSLDTLKHHLRAVIDRMAIGERSIERQKRYISRLASEGYSTAAARKTLDQLIETQSALQEGKRQLMQALGIHGLRASEATQTRALRPARGHSGGTTTRQNRQ
jgi:hypothetical protein